MGFVNDSICKESMKSKRLSQKGIDVAKKELDESSPYSFVAKEEKLEKIIGWTFFPVFYENREDPALQEQARMAKVTARLQLETTYMTTLNSPLTSSLMKSTKTRKPLSRDKTVFPILWGSWEN